MERSLHLAAEDHTGPGQARRLLREMLAEAAPELVDAAELAVTELVTNAALHAHTAVELSACLSEGDLRVEVRDADPALPLARHYDARATTGRGMALVQAITSACGVTPLGPDGKIVWFVLDRDTGAAEPDAEALLAAWDEDLWEVTDTDGDPVAEPPGPRPLAEPDRADRSDRADRADRADAVSAGPAPAVPVVPVVLEAFPPTLWLAARQHHDALLRELVLHLAEHPVADAGLDLAAADRARSVVSEAVVAEVALAEREGRVLPALPDGHPSPLPPVPAPLSLQVAVAATQAGAFAALQRALDAAEGLALQGELLSRPGLPEIVAVRDWVCDQVQDQLAGGRPQPWPGTAQPRFELDEADVGLVHPDVPVLLRSGRGVVAADEANRIVGISEGLARALGWDPARLVGRRIVTLIPPELREGHVAGFTRHLATGESHILGVPLRLPVLRADGTRVTCRFVVDELPPVDGRNTYLAWIDPEPTG